jgi:hypothetical protein
MALATLSCCVPFGVDAADEPRASRFFVLDAGAPALVSIDLASGKRTATLPLVGTPSWVVQSDDGRYLVVLDEGTGERKGERGYKAAGRSSATIVDATSLTAIGRVELGFGVDSVLTGADGRLTVTCPGYDAKQASEALPRELVVIELATARETGRMTLEPGTDLTWRSRDGRMLALLQGLPRSARYPFPKSKVTLVDVAGPSVTGALEAGGWDQAERDAERLYLTVRGRPDKNPQKNQNGSIDVISLVTRSIERVDIGRAPAGALLREDGLMVIVSEGPAGASAGELRIIRDGKLSATLPVAARPMLVDELGGALCVVGAKAVTLVDLVSLQVKSSLALEKAGQAIVDDDDRPFELVGTPDGRRAFIHYPAQDKVAVLDLEQSKAIGSTKTGRGGKKLLNSVMSTLTYGMSDRIYFYNSGDPPQMLVRADGRFAYALNLDTSDVSIVDAETAAVVQKIGAAGRALALLGETQLLVVGGPVPSIIDTRRNAKIGQVELSGLSGVVVAPDGSAAVALGERSLLILDGATGKERARLTDLVRPSRIVFGKSGAPQTQMPR